MVARQTDVAVRRGQRDAGVRVAAVADEVAEAPELLGARLLGRGNQRLASYLLETDVAEHAFSAEDREAFLAPLRQPERARAGSVLYRRVILPEMRRIATGAYRQSRLSVPTRVLYGPADPAVVPEMYGGSEPYADDLSVEPIEGAAHFLVDERPDAVADRILAFFGAS